MIKTFNWWTVLAPLGLLIALLTGYLSVRRNMCHVHTSKTIAPIIVNAVAAAIAFGVMVCCESFVGAFDFAIRTALVPGESEFWAALLAAGAIGFAAIVYGVLYVGCFLVGSELHTKIADNAARRQREECRRAKKDYQLMTTICQHCERAQTGHGYCPVGHITSEYEARPHAQDDDLPTLADTWEAHIEDFQCRQRIELPKVTLTAQHADAFRAGLTQAKQLFAEQAAAGTLCICVMTVRDCPVTYNREHSLNDESLHEWGAFLNAQTKVSDLPSVG